MKALSAALGDRWLRRWQGDLFSAVAGLLVPLSFAPYHLWPLGVVSAALLAVLLRGQSGGRGLRRAFLFGLGMYGAGTSWVYVSIHQFGMAPPWLAVTLTGLFVAGMALVFALPFYAFCRWIRPTPTALLFGFPAIWVLGEWVRSWLLTGFPWLYLGYGHIETWLAGWAPLWGVFGVSYFVALTGAGLVLLTGAAITTYRRQAGERLRLMPLVCVMATLLLAWLGGWGFQQVRWTHPEGDSVTVGMAQGNIAQELKWQPFYLTETLAIYRELSSQIWDQDWVIWPEAAIPLMYHQARPFLAEFNQRATATDTAFISGILYDDRETGDYYNTIVGLGLAEGIYHKQRLVPFGEYMPLERWLRGLIAFFDLPTSIIAPGPSEQDNLQAHGVKVSPYICYEVVYPDLVAKNGRDSSALITISNDAWFGESNGPLQHFQMAQMRALENGRYLVRATNNGVSGIIDPKGRVVTQGGRFTREVITGSVQPMAGRTPFAVWLSWPVVAACLLSLVALILSQRSWRQGTRSERQSL